MKPVTENSRSTGADEAGRGAKNKCKDIVKTLPQGPGQGQRLTSLIFSRLLCNTNACKWSYERGVAH